MNDLDAYRDLIARKAISFQPKGLKKIPALNSAMFPHQEACTEFALRTGCAGLFLATGMGKTAPKIDEQPTTLDEALKVIALMKDAHENALENLENELADAEDKIQDARENADNAILCCIEDACRVVQNLKSGRIREATDDLERLIQANDDDCKARTSAVAVMI